MDKHQPESPQPDQHLPPSEHQQPARRQIAIPYTSPLLTYLLLGIIVLIYILTANLSDAALNAFFLRWAKINAAIYQGEYYRLLTSMFIHLDLMHVFFNGYALYLFGSDVERLFGHLRFAIIYFLGGLSGSIASLLYTDAPSIGASGGVFAVFAAMGVYFYHHRHLYRDRARMRIIQMLVLAGISIVYGFIPDTRIDNAAHIGGLLGGFVLAWFISPELELQDADTPTPRVVDVNEAEQWIIVPVVYTIAMVAVVLLFSTT